MSFTIGSLFDGSGGFPLAATMCGGTPKWASEIEPYPIAVTKSRFPDMKHLGSVTDIKGGDVEPVDVITFGSPCQDLSVAGKRAGLKHTDNGDDETTRSGLFMEAVRIIKEMREATNGVYPRFALWENVPGAFSSNKGEDFRIVLEELIKVVEPSAVMPEVPKNGWPYADSYCGDGWSLAYRVLDAQFWGVPQRRRRIYLVADFRGECAGKVSFEREGVRGYFETGRTPWQTATGDAESGSGAADCERKCYGIDQGGIAILEPIGADIYNTSITGDVVCSLTAGGYGSTGTSPKVIIPVISADQGDAVPYTLKIRSGCEGGGKGALIQEDMSATLATNNDQYRFQPLTFDSRGNGDGKVVSTLTGGHECSISDYTSLVMQAIGEHKDCGKASSLKMLDYKDATDLVNGTNPGFQNGTVEAVPTAAQIRYIVRRLTPAECARLQGFPDTWGHPDVKDELSDEEYQFWLNVRNTHAAINDKAAKGYTKDQILKWYNGLHTDSSEYKMWGNGIALPNALYVMQGIAEVMSEEKTARRKWLDELLGDCL